MTPARAGPVARRHEGPSARTFAVAFTLALGSGCLGHVDLRPAPAKTAPRAERVAYLRENDPSAVQQSVYLRSGEVVGRSTELLILNNGARVEDPQDLRAAVEPASATATYAESFHSMRKTGTWLALGGTAGGVAGLMYWVASFLGMASATSISAQNSASTQALVGLGITSLGAIVAAVGYGFFRFAAMERDSAFLAYPKDLRRRLDLVDEEPDVGTPRRAR